MKLIDTHSHLNFPEFEKDLDKIIERARKNNIIYTIVIGINLKTNKKAIKLAEKYPNFISPAIGFHPHEVKNTNEKDYKYLESNLQKVVALGEIGLDWVKEFSPKEIQIKHFEKQLELAKRYNKPIILHMRGDRELWGTALEMLKDYSDLKKVFHCYTADKEIAKKILDLGGFISVTGVVTFKKAEDLRNAIKYIPLDRLMLETDCPFLAPHPVRGKRNEPAFLIYIAQKIAEIKNCDIEKIAEITTQNAIYFFELKHLKEG